MTLGQKVRQARIRAGLTQEQAAGGRITRNMLSLIENDLSAPSMKTLEYLAAALGVTAGWLLADAASDEAAERLPRAGDAARGGSSGLRGAAGAGSGAGVGRGTASAGGVGHGAGRAGAGCGAI